MLRTYRNAIFKMNKPNILLHKKHQIAFEELVRQESEKFVKRTKGKQILDKAKQYAVTIGVPNLIAGTAGYLVGGPECALETMKQVSISVLPYLTAFKVLSDLNQRKIPLDNINYVMEQTKVQLEKILQLQEQPIYKVIGTGLDMTLNAAAFYGLSLLTKKIFGFDADQLLMALTGAGIGLLHSASTFYVGNKWKNKILEYAEKNPLELEKQRGIPLELSDLECIVRGTLANPKTTNQIYVASSEKKFRGAKGALGFFGALDSLSDKSRDPARIKPNIAVMLESENWESNPKYPHFTFTHKREKSKTETILEAVRMIKAASKGADIKIHAFLDYASLDNMLTNPYEQLTSVDICGENDHTELFQVKYNFRDYNENNDEVEIILKSGAHLEIVPNLFQILKDRSLENIDFDHELIEISHSGDFLGPLANALKPKKENSPMYFNFFEDEKETPPPEAPEQLPDEWDNFSQVVLSAYKANKNRISSSHASGFPSMNIALEGAVYSLTPSDRDEKKEIFYKALYAIFHPIKTIKSLLSENEILPSLREAEVMTQIQGITKENVYSVIRELESRIEGLRIRPFTLSMDYDDFWQMRSNPNIMVDNAAFLELLDAKKTKIDIYTSDKVQNSYKSIRENDFPCREELKTRAEEIKQARQCKDYKKLSFRERFGKSRFEQELEKPTYSVVPANDEVPQHIIFFEKEDERLFAQNQTVHISTIDNIFIDTPVHPKEAVHRITKYLAHLRDSIRAVDQNQQNSS